jgi:hypothetical protein
MFTRAEYLILNDWSRDTYISRVRNDLLVGVNWEEGESSSELRRRKGSHRNFRPRDVFGEAVADQLVSRYGLAVAPAVQHARYMMSGFNDARLRIAEASHRLFEAGTVHLDLREKMKWEAAEQSRPPLEELLIGCVWFLPDSAQQEEPRDHFCGTFGDFAARYSNHPDGPVVGSLFASATRAACLIRYRAWSASINFPDDFLGDDHAR